MNPAHKGSIWPWVIAREETNNGYTDGYVTPVKWVVLHPKMGTWHRFLSYDDAVAYCKEQANMKQKPSYSAPVFELWRLRISNAVLRAALWLSRQIEGRAHDH
jgi:hypothetical protein